MTVIITEKRGESRRFENVCSWHWNTAREVLVIRQPGEDGKLNPPRIFKCSANQILSVRCTEDADAE